MEAFMVGNLLTSKMMAEQGFTGAEAPSLLGSLCQSNFQLGASFWRVGGWSIFLADAVFKWNYIASRRKIPRPHPTKIRDLQRMSTLSPQPTFSHPPLDTR
jgi:hypothetical protein